MKTTRCLAHLYIRTKTTNNFIFKCTRCPHYATKEVVLGNKAKCPYCTNEFTMDKRCTRLVNPHCGCRNTVKIQKSVMAEEKNRKKEKVVDEATSSFLDDLVRRL